jgi:subtilisin family serine protease
MTSTRLILILWIVTVFAGAASGRGTPVLDPLVPGKAMVGLQPGVDIQAVVDAINADFPGMNAEASPESIPSIAAHLLLYAPPAPANFEDALQTGYPSLLRWGDLVYEMGAPEGKSGSTWVGQVVQFDSYQGQYAVTKMNVAQAQAVSTAGGILIAVLDTGIDASHPQLQSRIATGGFNFVMNSTNTSDIGDMADNDGDLEVDEMTGHGTYVSGLIALVAPEARLLPVTVLNSDGVGDLWTLLRGMRHAIDRGVEVINLSLTTTYDSKGIFEALNDARELGIVVVAAAGNFDNDEIEEFPAMWDTENAPVGDEWVCFGVAATNHDDVKASFSNFHKNLFISAPGASVVSRPGVPNLDQSIISTLPGGTYHVWEGTSMAAPLVSAAVALVRAQHPEWPANLETFLSIRDVVQTAAVDICPLNPAFCPPGDDPLLGQGRLDVGAAVALGPPAPQPGDLDNDGVVSVSDLLIVVEDWGLIHTSADIDNDGVTGINDLLTVLTNWG